MTCQFLINFNVGHNLTKCWIDLRFCGINVTQFKYVLTVLGEYFGLEVEIHIVAPENLVWMITLVAWFVREYFLALNNIWTHDPLVCHLHWRLVGESWFYIIVLLRLWCFLLLEFGCGLQGLVSGVFWFLLCLTYSISPFNFVFDICGL